MRTMLLDSLQDSEKRSGSAGMRGDGAVRETLLFKRERSLARHYCHYASQEVCGYKLNETFRHF